jgi:hypothetical protein
MLWIRISITGLAIGYLLTFAFPDSDPAMILRSLSWLSLILAVGYFSRPSHRVFGRTAFAGSILIAAGIVMKVLHLPYADLTLVTGLCFILFSNVAVWLRGARQRA